MAGFETQRGALDMARLGGNASRLRLPSFFFPLLFSPLFSPLFPVSPLAFLPAARPGGSSRNAPGPGIKNAAPCEPRASVSLVLKPPLERDRFKSNQFET